MYNWYLISAYALAISFLLSAVLTEVMRRLAHRWRFYDHPGERKLQKEPLPLLGGVAIFLAFTIVLGGHLFILMTARPLGDEWLESNVFAFLGEDVRWKLAGVFVGGSPDVPARDRRRLECVDARKKLVGQIIAAAVPVFAGVRLDMFNPYVAVSIVATIFWILLMTNSLNFLDNMDGLSAGISVIAAFSFFACVFPQNQTFVGVLLMVFAGSVAGFLFHNFNPARIIMGDAGALFCGYFLAVVAVLSTFHVADGVAYSARLFAPILALGVPIFDIVTVVLIRWRHGESIMKGDKRHFSHRLVRMGMTQRQAVEFIYLVAAVTGFGAALLPRVGTLGSVMIICQAVGVFLLIVLLMNTRSGERPAE
jgi:UDP-GlcNAc:undecaprenyl-phosphate/decaprenyl-phosphate GlcNAc-1-phosphate transferase